MTAKTHRYSDYYAYCPECRWTTDHYETRAEAQRAERRHNRECHPEEHTDE